MEAVYACLVEEGADYGFKGRPRLYQRQVSTHTLVESEEPFSEYAWVLAETAAGVSLLIGRKPIFLARAPPCITEDTLHSVVLVFDVTHRDTF